MKRTPIALAIAGVLASLPALGADEIALLKQQLEEMKQEYTRRIEALETRLAAAEGKPAQPAAQPQPQPQPAAQSGRGSGANANAFNPAIGVILNGRYAGFSRDPEGYTLPGFPLANEGGLGDEGFSAGHSEVMLDANIDDKFYGRLTAALASHEGATEVELEEAYMETLGLGNGLTLRAGRFFSEIGYLNRQHPHAWDFADAPLIYRGLFGDQYYDDGVHLSWIAPTDLYLQLGGELFSGRRFPAADGDGVGAYTLFAKLGGDLGPEHSWQFGLSRWAADVDGRTAGGHDHAAAEEEHGEEGHEEGENEWLHAGDPAFSGDSAINAIDLVWKYAPNGSTRAGNLTLQAEYFRRDEEGTLAASGDEGPLTTWYDGAQSGWYAQGVYQFLPGWRFGLRYDWLQSDNRAGDEGALDAAGLHDEGHDPHRWSAMLDWSNSEFSRIRLQYNRDQSQPEADDQFFIQYIHSLGAHGAHGY